MAYLIKVTIIWSVFLVLFELLYKNNTRFTTNRIYLLLSITMGLVLPLIPSPTGSLWNTASVQGFTSVAQSAQTAGVTHLHSVVPPAIQATVTSTHSWDLMWIIAVSYCAGVLTLLMKYLYELFKIALLLRKNRVQVFYSHKVISTGKGHSPYSFMSYTFVTDITTIDPKELEYIIRHEAAHHTRKHWLDLWMLQLINIFFWFHPLVWRYRYLLQLQHEYEADAIAADHDPYTYGRFILQQTLLRGVPAITHSFHFSPIKNRINMLTKINSSRPDKQKYLLIIPALLACTFLMAKTNHKAGNEIPGNKMSYKGNILTLRQSDTLSYDIEKGKAEVVPANAKIKPQIIVGINNEPVYRNDYLQAQATYGNTSTAFADYVKGEFHKLRKNTADSLTYLVDLDLVVDKDGKIVYYDARYARPEQVSGQPSSWDIFYNWSNQANVLMDKIIADSPLWKPAVNDGKTVNSFVSVRFPGC